jgi:hypothetical protein
VRGGVGGGGADGEGADVAWPEAVAGAAEGWERGERGGGGVVDGGVDCLFLEGGEGVWGWVSGWLVVMWLAQGVIDAGGCLPYGVGCEYDSLRATVAVPLPASKLRVG